MLRARERLSLPAMREARLKALSASPPPTADRMDKMYH
jgi:hypothetical protein